MKTLISLALIFNLSFSIAQNHYYGRKGLRFFPGHLDIVVTTDKENLYYEVFYHWYAMSFEQYRRITIPLATLNQFNQENEEINIDINTRKIKVIDSAYKIQQRLRHTSTCQSLDTMRKIAYACKKAKPYENIRHFELYDSKDFELTENDFKALIDKNLALLLHQ